jgi:hypothetical protein
MKKAIIIVYLLLCKSLVFAQFHVKPFEQLDHYDMISSFPVVYSESNPEAAKNINAVLHYRSLEKVFQEDDVARFSAVFPPEGEIHGASEFSYDVIANNDRYFSVAIGSAYTGAYSEYFTLFYNFDAQTGQPIYLSDLFSEVVIEDITDWVSNAVSARIKAFMDSIDVDDPEGYGREQYDFYAECLSYYEEPTPLSDEYYFLTDSTITFVKGRCSNHMMAALDELWEFYESFPLSELENVMSENGLALMNGSKLKTEPYIIPSGKVLKGVIGGKYPITLFLRNTYLNHYSGVYWYDKVGKPISLYGKYIEEQGFLEIDEKVNDKVTGTMTLSAMKDGALEGDWISSDGSKTYEIRLESPY